jgi:hypothetical protein
VVTLHKSEECESPRLWVAAEIPSLAQFNSHELLRTTELVDRTAASQTPNTFLAELKVHWITGRAASTS